MKTVFWIVLGGVGVGALWFLYWMLFLVWNQYRYLKAFRKSLKRGSVVKVRGREGRQVVWSNLYDGFVLLMPDDNQRTLIWDRVPYTDIYPWNTETKDWLAK